MKREITKQILENIEASDRHLGVWLAILENSRNQTERDFALRGLEMAIDRLPQNVQDEARAFIHQSAFCQ